jgi:hypothetical protein
MKRIARQLTHKAIVVAVARLTTAEMPIAAGPMLRTSKISRYLLNKLDRFERSMSSR